MCCRRGRGLRGDVRVPVVRDGGVLPASRVCDRVSAVRHGASCVGQVLPRASRRVLLLLRVSVPARMLLRIGAIGGGCVVRVPWRQRRLRRGRRRQLAKLGVRRGVRGEFLRLLLLRVRVLTRARVLGPVRSTRTRLWARAVLRMRLRLRLRLRSTEQLVVRLLLPRAGRRGRHRKAAQDKRNGHTRESSSRPPTLASRESAARIRPSLLSLFDVTRARFDLASIPSDRILCYRRPKL